jgi:1,4-dihydroxy-2-naphthoate octaprenyltransferase
MFSRSSWLHLRIPFSLFLLPIFLFSLSVSPNFDAGRMLWVFIILHFLLYPASNGYNSYFDKDEKSIGGLRNPPPVSRGLYFLSLAMDALSIALSLIKINTTFAVMVLIYGLVSKAYSHPSIRLKRHAWTSWVITGLFQGLFTFGMCFVGVNDFELETTLNAQVLIPGLLTSAMLWANYPLTQVYQHEEDLRRGDHTLSAKLGIQGTFNFSAIVFAFALMGFVWYLSRFSSPDHAWIFAVSLLPVFVYFCYWLFLVRRNQVNADYTHTMQMNFVSSFCLNAYFIYLFLDNSQVLQLLR